MSEVWKIIYYELSSGTKPVLDFIASLPLKARAKIARSLDLLAVYNIHVHEPHAKKLQGTPLWELRILGQDSVRILYVAVLGKSFLLLHGFEKKTAKIPTKEISTALARFIDWKKKQVDLLKI